MLALLERYLADPRLSKPLLGKSHKAQMEIVRREVQRMARQDGSGWEVQKRVDRKIFVNARVIEELLKDANGDLKTSDIANGLSDVSAAQVRLELDFHQLLSKLSDIKKYFTELHDAIVDLQERQANIEEVQQHLVDAQAANTRALTLLSTQRAAPEPQKPL